MAFDGDQYFVDILNKECAKHDEGCAGCPMWLTHGRSGQCFVGNTRFEDLNYEQLLDAVGFLNSHRNSAEPTGIEKEGDGSMQDHTKKPLGDWTLDDVVEYCNYRGSCLGCLFKLPNGPCIVDCIPEDDPFDRWGEEEREDARDLVRLLPSLKGGSIYRYELSGDEKLVARRGECSVELDRKRFPSIRMDELVYLDEIIGEGNGDA